MTKKCFLLWQTEFCTFFKIYLLWLVTAGITKNVKLLHSVKFWTLIASCSDKKCCYDRFSHNICLCVSCGMYCTETRTKSRMLCNFWFSMLGGLEVYSFRFFLNHAWFNLIDYFPCIWLLSLQIDSHQEWVWHFLLDYLTILHYFTCSDAVTVANVLSTGVFLCACHIYLFSHSFVKTFHWWPCSKRYMEKFTSATGCMERADNQKISHLNLTGQNLSF